MARSSSNPYGLVTMFRKVFDFDTEEIYTRDDTARTTLAAILAAAVALNLLMIINTEAIDALNPIELSANTVDDYDSIIKYGSVFGLGAAEVTVWSEGTRYEYIDEAAASLGTSRILQVASDDTDDTAGGTGATGVIIVGQDTNFVEIQDVLALNGLTPVNTTKEFFRVYRVFITGAGSQGINDGTIDVGVSFVSGEADTAYATILPGDGQTQMMVYTVPAGFTAYFLDVTISTNEGKSAFASGFVRPLGGPWLRQPGWFISEMAFSSNLPIAFGVSEKTDVELRARTDGAGLTVDVSAIFSIVLKPN